MRINDIDRGVYGLTFNTLFNMAKEYVSQVERSLWENINSSPESYTNMFLKLLGEFSNDYPQELSKLPNLEQVTVFHDKRILEVGCSIGYFLDILTQLGAECYGVDIKDFGSLPQSRGVNYRNINLLEVDITHPNQLFPKADFDQFDAVITRCLLEYPIRTKEETEEFIGIFRRLSRLQIHESGLRTGYISPTDLERLGFSVDAEIIEKYLTGAELYIIKGLTKGH